MIYRFGAFELDLAAAELRADGIARGRNAALRGDDFFRAFPMRPESTRLRVLGALRQLGF